MTVQCALRRWEEDFSLINMRWLLQPEKVSASVFLHGRQFDLQTGRQSAPAGQAAALVVVRYQMHQTQQSCPLQCVQHIAASSIIKSPPLLIAILNSTPSFSSPTQKWSQTNMTPRSAVLYSLYTQSLILWHSQTALPFLPDCFLITDHPYQISFTVTRSDLSHNVSSSMQTILKNRDFLLHQLIVFCPIFSVFASKFGQNLTEVIAWTAWLCAEQFLRTSPT